MLMLYGVVVAIVVVVVAVVDRSFRHFPIKVKPIQLLLFSINAAHANPESSTSQ